MQNENPSVNVRVAVAAKRTGLTTATLRAWERRYGVPKPARSSNKYRLYDELALAEVAAMKILVDQDMSPQQAAIVVQRRRDATVEAMSPEPLLPASEEHVRLEGALRANWGRITPRQADGLTALVKAMGDA